MQTRTLLAPAIAIVIALACHPKGRASGDDTAAAADSGAQAGDTSDSEPTAAADDSVPVDVTVTLSGGHAKDDGTYHAVGNASLCQHVAAPADRAPEWSIAHGGGGSGPGAADVELKVGKTTGGTTGQMFAMITVVRADGLASPHFINTFTSTVTAGSGTVKVTPQGTGARFDLSGVADDGTKITAAVVCKKLSA